MREFETNGNAIFVQPGEEMRNGMTIGSQCEKNGIKTWGLEIIYIDIMII